MEGTEYETVACHHENAEPETGLIEDIMAYFRKLRYASGMAIEELQEQLDLPEFDQDAQFEMIFDYTSWAREGLQRIESHNDAVLEISAKLSDNPVDFEHRLRIMGFVVTFVQTYAALAALHMAAARGKLWVKKSDVDRGHLAHVLGKMADVNRVAALELRYRGAPDDERLPATHQAIQDAWFTRPDSASRADGLPCAWPALPWQQERLRRERGAQKLWAQGWRSRRTRRLEVEPVPILDFLKVPLPADEEAIELGGIVVGPHTQPRLPAVTFGVEVRVKFGESATSNGFIRRTWYMGDLS